MEIFFGRIPGILALPLHEKTALSYPNSRATQLNGAGEARKWLPPAVQMKLQACTLKETGFKMLGSGEQTVEGSVSCPLLVSKWGATPFLF